MTDTLRSPVPVHEAIRRLDVAVQQMLLTCHEHADGVPRVLWDSVACLAGALGTYQDALALSLELTAETGRPVLHVVDGAA